MTAREYKITHGLPLRSQLMAPDLVDGHRKRGAERVGGEAWKRLEAKRDPTKAARARDDEAHRKRGPSRGPSPAATAAAREAATAKYAARDREWTRREDAGESLVDIARADGVPVNWVAKAVARYRKRHGVPLSDTAKKARADRSRAAQQVQARMKAEAVRARDDDFLRRFENGETATAIAREVGMTNSAVSYGIRRARRRRDEA